MWTCYWDVWKLVPDFSPLKEGKYDRHVHYYLLFFIPMVPIKKEENERDIFFFFFFWLLKAVEPTDPPRTHQQSSPPQQKKEKKSLKGFLSAGFCLCTERVQSITLSLIIRVTTSWAARALTLTPPNHYGATGLTEWPTLICSEESYGDIFQPPRRPSPRLASPRLPHPPSGERL